MAKKDKTEPRGTVAKIPVWCRFDEGVTLEKLVPHPRNYNKHPDSQIALLAKIIKAQGWRNPVVVSKRSGFVVKGHGRIEAARLMQVDAVPVEYQDYETEAAEYADMIADNRIAELAEPDNAMLKSMLAEIDESGIDMDLTGFDAGELLQMMSQPKPQTQHQVTSTDVKSLESATDQSTPETDTEFESEMSDDKSPGTAPIVPMYAEHHQAFVILCNDKIDETWLRNKLGLESPLQSYKDGKIRQANVATVAQLRKAFQ